MFNTALMDWFIALPCGNPLAQILKPALPPAGRERRVSEEEEAVLLEAAGVYGGNIGPIIRFALETAMRRGELAAMHWTHVAVKRPCSPYRCQKMANDVTSLCPALLWRP